MNWTVTFYAALLFFILTPAVLVRLPPKGNKYTVAAFHALVFALIFHFTAKLVWQVSKGVEGFREGATTTYDISALSLAEKNAKCDKYINTAYDGSSIETPLSGAGTQACLTGSNVTYCNTKSLSYKSVPGNHVCTPPGEPIGKLTTEQITAYKAAVAILNAKDKKILSDEQIAALKLGARTS